MIQPIHHSGYTSGHWAVSYRGPCYQDYRQMQAARGLQLCQSARAAGVFGNDMSYPVVSHQIHVGFNCKGSATKHDHGIWHGWSGIGRIYHSKQVEMLGLGGKSWQVLFAYGKEYALGSQGQSRNRSLSIRYMKPFITRLRQPCGAFVRDHWDLRHGTCLNRIATDLGGKGMRRIDDMGDLCIYNVVGKAFDATVTAQAGWQGLLDWVRGAPGVGKYGVDACCGKGMGKGGRLGCATQKKDAHNG